MILGRPTNLWLGFTTALLALVQILAVQVWNLDPTATATTLGAVGVVLGAAVSLIANQTPVVTPGSNVTVQTTSGQPNATATLDLSKSGEVVVK